MERTTITIDKKQLEWLEEKVRSGEFASVSHGIRRCVDKVMKEGEK